MCGSLYVVCEGSTRKWHLFYHTAVDYVFYACTENYWDLFMYQSEWNIDVPPVKKTPRLWHYIRHIPARNRKSDSMWFYSWFNKHLSHCQAEMVLHVGWCVNCGDIYLAPWCCSSYWILPVQHVQCWFSVRVFPWHFMWIIAGSLGRCFYGSKTSQPIL